MLTLKLLEKKELSNQSKPKELRKKDDSVLFPVAMIKRPDLGEKELTIAGYSHS